jgi:hypothetical protein
VERRLTNGAIAFYKSREEHPEDAWVRRGCKLIGAILVGDEGNGSQPMAQGKAINVTLCYVQACAVCVY